MAEVMDNKGDKNMGKNNNPAVMAVSRLSALFNSTADSM
jgi:hypothetical protein